MNFLLVLSPQYGPAEFGDYTTVSVSGGVLTVEGRDYAFPDLEDGGEATRFRCGSSTDIRRVRPMLPDTLSLFPFRVISTGLLICRGKSLQRVDYPF
ncbi:TPA: hypothetical protein ACHGQU_000281 [Pseudomonas aeruginosa]